MKAIQYTNYGPPEVLHLIDIEKPKPKDNEVLIKVKASTVTSGTVWARSGTHPDSKFFTLALRLVFGLTKPKNTILGYEFSGEVETAGKNANLFKKGDLVFGTTTGLKAGAYAEYVCVPEVWKQGVIAKKPENISHEEAAALPIGAMTALYLLNKANIQRGQKVLIYGASGSVGTFAVQLAKHHFDAEVTGVCSTSNIDLVSTLGADKVIDYTQDDFSQNREKYDVVFDAVSKISSSKGKSSLKKNGVFLSVKSPTAETMEGLKLLISLAKVGKIKSVIDKRYPLEETVAAHRYADKGHKKGNVVINIQPNK